MISHKTPSFLNSLYLWFPSWRRIWSEWW